MCSAQGSQKEKREKEEKQVRETESMRQNPSLYVCGTNTERGKPWFSQRLQYSQRKDKFDFSVCDFSNVIRFIETEALQKNNGNSYKAIKNKQQTES